MDDNLTLRAFREEDREFLDRLDTDPAALGPFEWFGFRDVRTRRRRWEHDGFVGQSPRHWRSWRLTAR
jgi:[ribosomal protein S5]-alanine N-acetyltransferase